MGPSRLNKIACVRPERFDNSSQVLKPLQPCEKAQEQILASLSSAVVTVTPASRPVCGSRDKVCWWLVLRMRCQREEAGADAGAGTAHVHACVYRPNQRLSAQSRLVGGRCWLNYRVKEIDNNQSACAKGREIEWRTKVRLDFAKAVPELSRK